MAAKRRNLERDLKIYEARKAGQSVVALAKEFHLTKARISQIIHSDLADVKDNAITTQEQQTQTVEVAEGNG